MRLVSICVEIFLKMVIVSRESLLAYASEQDVVVKWCHFEVKIVRKFG